MSGRSTGWSIPTPYGLKPSPRKHRIRDALGEKALAIEHYGSTAVPGLRAKPNIDLQIGVADINHGLLFIEPIAKLGYDYAGDQGIPGKRCTRTHLAHIVVYQGDSG